MKNEKQTTYVIMACHNRREMTSKALSRVKAAAEFAGCGIEIVVFDDGSTDGTAEVVAQLNPEVKIIPGDGSAYWAKSMAIAESYVLNELDPTDNDLILWLNDDVDLDEDSLSVLLRTHHEQPDSVIVGAVNDPISGTTTYSGFRRYGRHALHLSKVEPLSEPLEIDSLNGNVVLVPVTIAHEMGGIDGSYSHAWADLDYGFRCRKAGIRIVLAPGFSGSCSPNPPTRRHDILSDWYSFIGPKGAGNFRSLAKILRVQSPRFWFPQWAGTYALWWARESAHRVSGLLAKKEDR